MKAETWFKDQLKQYANDAEFVTEKVILDINEKIVCKMEALKMNRTELASKLNVSKAFVTKLLNGNQNLTVRTMVSIAIALGCEIDINFRPAGFELRGFFVSSKNETAKIDVKEDDYASAA